MGFYERADLAIAPLEHAERRLTYESGVLFLTIDFEAGFKVPPHKHPWPTVLYVSHGSGQIAMLDQSREVSPGMLVIIPPETVHSIETVTGLGLLEMQPGVTQQFVDGLLGRH